MKQPQQFRPHPQDPILVLGAARSGTGWLAHTLARPWGYGYVREPDNWTHQAFAFAAMRACGEYPSVPLERPSQWALWRAAFGLAPPVRPARRQFGRLVRKGFQTIPWDARVRDFANQPVDSAWRLPLRLVDRFASPVEAPDPGSRPVVKSVHALWVAERVVAEFQPTVVLIRRRPIESVGSWIDLGFEPLEMGGQIRTRLLDPLGITAPASDAPVDERIAWTCGVLDLMTRRLSLRHPTWILLHHADLANDPVAGFGRAFDLVGADVAPEQLRRWVADGADVSRPTRSKAYSARRDPAKVVDMARRRLGDERHARLLRVLEPFEAITDGEITGLDSGTEMPRHATGS